MKRKLYRRRVEHRWAIAHNEGFLCGKYCWDNAREDDPVIPTFRTRKLAREAKKRLNSYRKCTQVVRVSLATEPLGEVP